MGINATPETYLRVKLLLVTACLMCNASDRCPKITGKYMQHDIEQKNLIKAGITTLDSVNA